MQTIRGAVSSAVAVPRYRWIQLTILVVLVVAFVTSFQSGAEGAHQSGYRAEFSASFPLICDVVAMLATVVHGWARHDAKMRRLAALFVMGPDEGGRWADEGPVVTFIDKGGDATHLVSYNLETDARTRLIDGSDLRAPDVGRLIQIEGYQYSRDGSKVLASNTSSDSVSG